MIRPRFLPAAEADLLKEVRYYSNAREGLGIKLYAAVSAAVTKAAASPNSGALSPKGTQSRLVRGFPFALSGRPRAKAA